MASVIFNRLDTIRVYPKIPSHPIPFIPFIHAIAGFSGVKRGAGLDMGEGVET